jgi:hypothetical protein
VQRQYAAGVLEYVILAAQNQFMDYDPGDAMQVFRGVKLESNAKFAFLGAL